MQATKNSFSSAEKHSAIFSSRGFSFHFIMQTRFWFKYTALIRYFSTQHHNLKLSNRLHNDHNPNEQKNLEIYHTKILKNTCRNGSAACLFLFFSKVFEHDSGVLDPKHANSNTTYPISSFSKTRLTSTLGDKAHLMSCCGEENSKDIRTNAAAFSTSALIEERKKGSDDSAKPSKERPQKGGDGDAITSFQSQIPLRLHGWNPSGLAFLQPSTTPLAIFLSFPLSSSRLS